MRVAHARERPDQVPESIMLATILLLLLVGLIPCAIIIAVYERAAQRTLRRRVR